MAKSKDIKFEKWDGVNEKQFQLEQRFQKVKESVRNNIIRNINSLNHNQPIPPALRIFREAGNNIVVTLRYGTLPIWQACINKGDYQLNDVLNTLLSRLDEGEYDKCCKDILKQIKRRKSLRKRRYSTELRLKSGKIVIPSSKKKKTSSSAFVLTEEQKDELENFPLLKSYVESYIENDGCPDKLFSITDFTMFFKRLWFENINETELFPEWEEGADEYYKDPENTSEDNWFANFNSCGSNSRWSYGEEYIQENFSKCVDSAIRLAKKYGDFDIHAEKINIRRNEE